MSHRYITSGPGVPPAGAPYSAAVVAGDHCYISGQVATDPETGEILHGTAQDEIRVALTNLLAIARAAGFAPNEFVYVQILLADMEDFSAINEVYETFFPADARPARMCTQAGDLPVGARVEVQATAVKRSA
ncbi:MAG TPA: Rid family hydrolase [Baekduia sp.]|nr:Rid family hydrolase [Baekduia sp.]